MTTQKLKQALPIIKKDVFTSSKIVSQKSFVGYAGWTGFGNLGDEAVYEAAKNLFPNIRTFAIDKRVRWFMDKSRRQIPLDAFYLGGGTLINRSMEWLEFARYVNVRSIPSFCIGTGVASADFWAKHTPKSWENNISEWAPILKDFIFLGVRGPRSQQALKDAGVKSVVVGDSAFSLNIKPTTIRSDQKIIGLNVCFGTGNVMWGDQTIFISEIQEFIRKAILKGYEVRLLPMWSDDESISIRIEQTIRNERCKVIRAYNSTQEYFEAIACCSVFIGEKLHATIFSCMLGIPSIMLAYRPKCFDFMESIEMQNYCIKTDDVTSTSLWELLEDIQRQKGLPKKLEDNINYYKHLQSDVAEKIRKQI